MSKMPVQKPDKNAALIGQVIEIIVSFIIIFFVDKIFTWLVKPIISRVSSEAIEAMIEKKQEAREAYLSKVESDFSDPMVQFQLRFLEEAETYKGDADNEVYKAWYEAWKNGQILDSKLRWVPVVYQKDEETFNLKFLEYMRIQYGLHGQVSFLERARFLRTIQKFYPELSSDYTGLGQDLASLCEAIIKDNTQASLKKAGLPQEYAEALVGLNLPTEKLQEAIVYLKQCIAQKYVAEAAVMAYQEGLEVTSDEARVINAVVRCHLPAYVGLVVIREEITAEELVELASYMIELIGANGDTLMEVQPSGFTLYEEFLDERIKKYRIAKLAKSCL